MIQSIQFKFPKPPPIFDESIILNTLGEPTLQSLGLGSYYFPTGNALYFLKGQFISRNSVQTAYQNLNTVKPCLYPMG